MNCSAIHNLKVLKGEKFLYPFLLIENKHPNMASPNNILAKVIYELPLLILDGFTL